MNTNTDLHFILIQVKGGLASRGNGTGRQSHTHTTSLIVDSVCESCNLCQWCTSFGQATYNFFQENGNTNATTTSSPGAILHSDVIVGYDTCHLDTISGSQFSRHFTVEYVACTVLVDTQYTVAPLDRSQ